MCKRYSATTVRPDSRTNIPLYYCEDLPHKDFNDPNSLVTEHHPLPNQTGLVHLSKRQNLTFNFYIKTESFIDLTKKIAGMKFYRVHWGGNVWSDTGCTLGKKCSLTYFVKNFWTVLKLEMEDTIDTILYCSSDFTERCDTCQDVSEWSVRTVFGMLCWHSGCWEDTYRTRWHTCAPEWRLFSFHCHMGGRWESNLRIKEGARFGNQWKRGKISNASCNDTSNESFTWLYIGIIHIITHLGCD